MFDFVSIFLFACKLVQAFKPTTKYKVLNVITIISLHTHTSICRLVVRWRCSAYGICFAIIIIRLNRVRTNENNDAMILYSEWNDVCVCVCLSGSVQSLSTLDRVILVRRSKRQLERERKNE